MPERLEIQNQQDIDLKKQLENVKWPVPYGNVKVQIRNGKPTLVTIERTIKLDDNYTQRPELTTRAPTRKC